MYSEALACNSVISTESVDAFTIASETSFDNIGPPTLVEAPAKL